MIKKKLILSLFLSIVFISLITQVNGYFFLDHEYWTIKSFEEIDSAITQQCRPFLEEVLNGVQGTDGGVIHYRDDKVVSSYIGLHQKGAGFDTCMIEAGSSVRKKCVCIGNGIHIIHDSFAHLEDGIVAKTINKWGGTNFIGHMIVERNFERKHQKFIANDPIVTSGTLAFFDSRALDLFFDDNDEPTDLLDLFNSMSGLDMENDFRTVRAGYQGVGFFDMAYRDRLMLPFQLGPISIAMILIGYGMVIFILLIPLIFKVKLTNWKFIAIIPWILLALTGTIIQVSVFTGTSWQITNILLDIAGSTGYLGVSDSDVEFYNALVLDATKEFLQTGQLTVEDASGLSFVDSNGFFHEGALSKAENRFFIFVLPMILILYILVSWWTIRRAFGFKGLFRFRK